MKRYTIHFMITTQYNECIQYTKFKRNTKKEANQLVKELSRQTNAKNSMRTDKSGFNHFDKLDKAGDFHRIAYVTQRTIKSKKGNG